MSSTRATRWFVYALMAIAVITIIWSLNSNNTPQENISISTLAQQVKAGEVAELVVSGDGRTVTVMPADQNQEPTQSQISHVSSIEEILIAYGINEEEYADGIPTITYEQPSPWGSWLNLVGIFLPAIMIIGFFYFIFRQAQGNNNQAMSFGKSRARMITGDHPTVGFDDVAGAYVCR